jgi:hypothetical protein
VKTKHLSKVKARQLCVHKKGPRTSFSLQKCHTSLAQYAPLSVSGRAGLLCESRPTPNQINKNVSFNIAVVKTNEHNPH